MRGRSTLDSGGARKQRRGAEPDGGGIRDGLLNDSSARGAIMGDNPPNSVVNTYLRHWQVPNLFAITLRSADALIDRCLKKPGMLV